jgi:hypothetical protein
MRNLPPRELVSQLGKPRKSSWSFPRADKELLPTWYSDNLRHGPIAITVGGEDYCGRRRKRTPILIARAQRRDSTTPTAEINIRSADGTVNRSTAGCLCLRADGRFLLIHRGQRFTAMPSVIPKKIIHQYCSRGLPLVTDDDKATPVTRVGHVGPHLVTRIAAFGTRLQL